jgi:protocatechuate 3,4-dioxygenase beta subunit
MNFKKIHLLSGIILTLFVGLHLFNHIWSINGVDAHINMMQKLRWLYRNLIVEVMLLLAVLLQIYTGIILLLYKKIQQYNFFEKLQVWSGGYLAFFLLVHVSAVLIGRFFLALDTNFYFGVAGIHSFPVNLFFVPYYALAIISFFSHIAAIHAQKMQFSVLGFSPFKQAYFIITMGVVITILIFIGLTLHFKGVNIPKAYQLFSQQMPGKNNYNQALQHSDTLIGGGCEGCELMYVGMPNKISSTDTSIGWMKGKQKLIITGKIFLPDGKTPAANVIVYYWHTDDEGLYSADNKTPSQAKEHGKLRGWIKTDTSGNYTIYTSRPAAYPQQNIPQHIHLAIKEPQINNAYYADLYFDDDPLYLPHKRKYGKKDRAGTEILRVLLDKKVQVAEHNIIVGLNIPNYPIPKLTNQESGLKVGEDQPSFMPYHAFGPDKGTTTCPVCKYGRYHGIIYFVGNNTNWAEIKQWLIWLDTESIKRQNYLKAYFVYGNSKHYQQKTIQTSLDKMGNELGLKKIALTFVPSFSDSTTEVYLNKINPEVENTFIIYKHRTIIEKFINLKPNNTNFNLVAQSLNRTTNKFFLLPQPQHK